jgi:hypothetical protein
VPNARNWHSFSVTRLRQRWSVDEGGPAVAETVDQLAKGPTARQHRLSHGPGGPIFSSGAALRNVLVISFTVGSEGTAQRDTGSARALTKKNATTHKRQHLR